MRINLSTCNIEIINSYSRKRLLEIMSGYKHSILLGGNIDSEKEFYALVFNVDSEQECIRDMCIGICYGSHGITPQIMVQDNPKYAWIGYDSGVDIISIQTKDVISHIDLDWLFYQSVRVEEAGLILIHHEIGVQVVDTMGNPIWKISKDVINDLRVHDNHVFIKWMDGDECKLNLLNGEVL